MIRVCSCLSMPLTESELVDYDADHTKIGFRYDIQQRVIEGLYFERVLQMLEDASAIDDVFAVQNRWIVWVVRYMDFLESFQPFMEHEVVPILEPAAKKTQVTMVWTIEAIEHMIT